MSFVDKTLTCRDCGSEFVFTVGEQEFFAEKGFTNAPTRCVSCRRARKAQANGGASSGYGGSYSGSSYSSGGYRSERPERQMFEAVCSGCGQTALVPFEPRLDKPVYCNDCFRSRRQPRGYSNW